ncbi:MAG: hypothetical protein V8S58_02685 [Lachnospiraceae bacterium]
METEQSFFHITDMMSLVAEERAYYWIVPYRADLYQIWEDGYRGVRLEWKLNGKAIEHLIHAICPRDVRKDLAERQAVDAGRIYACGQSFRGYMTACWCIPGFRNIFAAVHHTGLDLPIPARMYLNCRKVLRNISRECQYIYLPEKGSDIWRCQPCIYLIRNASLLVPRLCVKRK